MPELGKAYVQIVPSAQGISGSISSAIGGEAESAGKSAGAGLGGNLVSSLKGVIAAAGIGAAIKATLDAGGDLQQSFGGLDTIYGDASEAAKKYAYEAQQAGISANEYAETAVSFGASLKQAFEGDTTKAMESANTAILDMTDNAAKMGTPIESIQNAYQGFAKQNYTMLDNLKLGYGGTKSEMERLLADATELSGVEYNIDNLGDVYEAIHVIQGDLGLTGVAADEAASTFTGSFGAMQAAAQNLMANLATGADITEPLGQLMDSAQTFIFNNLAPMIGNIAAALPDLVSGLGTFIIAGLNIAATHADELVQQGAEIVAQLALAIVAALPYIAEAAINLVKAFGEAFMNTDWIGLGNKVMTELQSSMSLAAGEIFGSDASTITEFLNGITKELPRLLEMGVQIITNLANGILQNLPELITIAGTTVTQFAAFILQNIPQILSAGGQLLLNLVSGIKENLPQIVSSAADVIANFCKTLLDNLPQILQAGIELIGKLVAGIIEAIPTVLAAIIDLILQIGSKLLEYDWGELGKNMLEGIGKGIANAAGSLVDALWGSVSGAIDFVKSQLGIHSPSTFLADNVGKWMGLGVGVGFVDNLPEVEMADAVKDAALSMDITSTGSNVPVNRGIDYTSLYNAVRAGAEAAHLAIDIDGRDLTRTLKSLGVAMA